jgi:hypothetical protein
VGSRIPARLAYRAKVGYAWIAMLLLLGIASIFVIAIMRHHGLPADLADWAQVVDVMLVLVSVGVAIFRKRQEPPGIPPESIARAAALIANETRTTESKQYQHLIGLGRDDTIPADILFSRHATKFRSAGGAPTGSLSSILSYYNNLTPGRLIIVGDPGSGKTILALTLLLELLKARASGASTSGQIPVWLSLSSIDFNVSFEDWLTAELVRRFPVSTSMAHQLVEQRMILPVLDGLDEIVNSGRVGPRQQETAATRTALTRIRQVVDLLNRYMSGNNPATFVLTCRTDQYERLTRTILDATAVYVEPLTSELATNFLLDSTEPGEERELWQPVFQLLRDCQTNHSRALMQLLDTPWKLTLAYVVFGEEPSELIEVCRPTARGGATEYRLPLHRYIEAICRKRDRTQLTYDPNNVERWLGSLAKHLRNQAQHGGSGMDLTLHGLWTLSGRRQVQIAHLAIAGPAAIVTFLAAALVVQRSTNSPVQLIGLFAVALLLSLGLARVLTDPDTTPIQPNYREQLTTRIGWFQLTTAMAGAVISTEFTMSAGSRVSDSMLAGAIAGLLGALSFGGLLGILKRKSGTGLGGSTSPHDTFKPSIAAGVAFGLIFSAIMAALVALSEPMSRTTAYGVPCWAVFWITLAFPVASVAWQRYVITLAIMRFSGALPVRMVRFLDWATTVTLMRTVGVAYQFRHSSIQEWILDRALSQNIMPPSSAEVVVPAPPRSAVDDQSGVEEEVGP